MSGQSSIQARHRRPRRPLRARFEPLVAAAGGGEPVRPALRLPEPQGARGELISGSLVTLAHLGLFTLLVVAALLAPPEFVEHLIPVQIVRERQPVELPGSNREPAPATPKAVAAARPSAAALAAAQALSPARAEALSQQALEAAQRALETLRETSASAVPALQPASIARRSVKAERLEAKALEATPSAAAFDVPIESPRADDTLSALPERVALHPLALPPSALLPAPDPRALRADLAPAQRVSATPSAAPLAPSVAPGTNLSDLTGTPRGAFGTAGATRAADAQAALGAGGGSGGTGRTRGVARCLESAPVGRYLDGIRRRTNARWHIPEGVSPDTQVVLRFDLDAAGMATDIEAARIEDAALGESAMRALRAAAPFPATDEATRCLSEKRIKLTFTVPRLSSGQRTAP